MEVYTGYGDKGMTDLSHTKNVSKSDDRICLMGSVEELMSHIGLVRVLVDDVDVVRMLEKISETLKKIIDGVSDPYNREFKVSEDRTELLEEEIGRMKEIFSGERLPILPGDSRVAAEIDVTRAVARRSERELALVSVKFGSDTGAKKYMNRLSDYFYVLARYVDVAKIEEKKTDISESVQESVKAETAGIVANVGVEAVGSSADVAAGTSAVDVRAQDSQMVQKRDVQTFNAQNGTVTTAVGGNTAMAQNDSMAANTAMIQEVLKRMGIQGRITLDSAKRLIEKIEQEALRRNKPSVIAVCSPDGNPVAVHVMDGSFLVSFDMAVKKAYTSVAVKMSTMELSRLTQPGQTFYGLGKMSDNIVIFGGGVPLKVGDTIWLEQTELTVAGVLEDSPFDTTDQPIVICSERMFTDITGEDAYAVLDVQLSSKASEQNVNELHALSDGHYDFYDRMAQNKDTQNTYFMFCLFVYGFLAVITLITVIHTVNSISMSVSARTKQYGVMRAVGMDDLQIKKMISMETATYTIFGLFAGCGLGLPLHYFFYTQMITDYWGTQWQLPSASVAGILALLVIVSLLAPFLPAKRICNMPITATINEL